MPPIRFGKKNTERKKFVPFIFLVNNNAKANANTLTVITDTKVKMAVKTNASAKSWFGSVKILI